MIKMELENWKYKLRDAFLYFIYFYVCFNLHKHEGVSEFWEPQHTKNIIICSYFGYLCNLNTTNCTFFPFGNLKCWHVMTYPKESLLKTNEMLKTALSSFILVHRHVTGCVRWRMKHFLTDTKRSQKWITFSLLTHIQHSYQAKMPLQGSEQILILKRTKWDKVINARIERQQR